MKDIDVQQFMVSLSAKCYATHKTYCPNNASNLICPDNVYCKEVILHTLINFTPSTDNTLNNLVSGYSEPSQKTQDTINEVFDITDEG